MLITTLCIYGCASDETKNATPTVAALDILAVQQVDLIGEWSYEFSTKKSICDGFIAVGYRNYISHNGNLDVVGGEITQGEGLDVDKSGNCVLTSIDKQNSSWIGLSSNQTSSSYEIVLELNKTEVIKSVITVGVFTESKITYKSLYENGVSTTMVLTRL